jgi:8-oxo-dGTP pyrophosphatase MutT (NUDIX family)
MEPVAAVPAATVVPLRDGPGGLETLMLHRSSSLAFAGGMWVWPGGRVEVGDHPVGALPADPALDDADMLVAARRAAVREATEESGLVLDPATLVWFSHWTPPVQSNKRYSTWFFAAPAPVGIIEVDGSEIRDHAWWSPAEAMRRRDALEIELSPPTWITLEHLRQFESVTDALDELGRTEPMRYATRFGHAGDEAVCLYHGDVAYDDVEQADRPGPRHRLWMRPTGWVYERSD